MPRRAAAPVKRSLPVKSAQISNARIYGELIAEASSHAGIGTQDERPLKRPRTGRRQPAQAQDEPLEPGPDLSGNSTKPLNEGRSPLPATDTDGEHITFDEDSGLEFEDVQLEQHVSTAPESSSEDDDIAIVISTGPKTTVSTPKRKPSQTVPKSTRILGHKAHLVTLVGYCMIANSRCNDYLTQKRAKRLLTPAVRKLLLPDESASQFQRNHALMSGLQKTLDVFKGAYRVSGSGMSRAVWRSAEDLASVIQSRLDGATFQSLRSIAKSLTGTQDEGALLFCAMLRSVGVKTRLICSLQTLPLSTSQPKQATSSKTSTVAMTVVPGVNHVTRHTGSSPRPTPTVKLAYPIFWTEVFDAAYQKWIPVDAVVTHTIKKPTKLEPPASYELNQMSYVFGFNEDGSMKDVTRRYARSYNAKTRRTRIESISIDEMTWYRKLLRLFRASPADRGNIEIEDAELTRKEASEGMPANILDFVGHPVYALERHLKRNEVVHPRREAGKVNAGTAAKPNMESVFRRQDVHACRSADQWYRIGRVIRPASQPLKTVPARRPPRGDQDSDEERDTTSTVGLYSLTQTELYIPKRVKRGRVPRNAFGNIDVYVPSMVPPGGVHIRHQLASTAATILEIDAVDAVVGFKFTGRKGAAVVDGAVVPIRHQAAINAVIEGLEWEIVLRQCQTRSLYALRLWKKFLQGLKISARVAAYRTGHDAGPVLESNAAERVINSQGADEELYTAGKYIEAHLVAKLKTPKPVAQARPTRRVVADTSSSDDTASSLTEDESISGGFGKKVPAVSHEGGGFMHENEEQPLFANPLETTGGFFPENGDFGGGFILDDEISYTVDEPTLNAEAARDRTLASRTEDSPILITEASDPHINDEVARQDFAITEPSSYKDIEAATVQQADTDAERESRLSHDPADDDADPEWMASD